MIKVNENILKKHLDFYRYSRDIDQDSKKEIIKVLNDYSKELQKDVTGSCKEIFEDNIKIEIKEFIELNKEVKDLKELINSEGLSKIQKIKYMKELNAKTEALADSYLELSSLTYFDDEVRRLRSQVTTTIFNNISELDSKITMLEATISILEYVKSSMQCMTANRFIIEGLHEVSGISLSEDQLYRLNSLVDVLDIEL